MQVFDLKEMKSFPYEERDKNVFYKEDGFKIRIIELPPGAKNAKLRNGFIMSTRSPDKTNAG